MIQSWREGFAAPEAYFGFVQLSTSCHNNIPGFAELREAQMKALKKVPGNIAYSTNADRGDGCNIHPPAKQDCGIRLGRSALAIQYGQSSIHWKSPSYSRSRRSTTDTSVTIALQDVSPQGLYLIDVPFSVDPNRPSREKAKSRCEDLELGTCGGAQVLLSDGKGWVHATIEITDTNEITLTAKTRTTIRGKASEPLTVVASRYGFAQIPLLTIYDKGTDLPVLPWRADHRVTVIESTTT